MKETLLHFLAGVALTIGLTFSLAPIAQAQTSSGSSGLNVEQLETIRVDSSQGFPDLVAPPPEEDITFAMLRQIIGPGLDKLKSTFFAGTGAPSDIAEAEYVMAGTMLRISAAIAVMFGGILMLYITIVGLLKSSQSGEFLGQWDSTFLPLRMIIAFGAALPAPQFGGLALVQVVVCALGMLGIGTASAVWSWSADKMIKEPSIALPQISNDLVRASEGMLRAYLCEYASEEYGDGQFTDWSRANRSDTRRRFYSATQYVIGERGNECGEFRLKQTGGRYANEEITSRWAIFGFGSDDSANTNLQDRVNTEVADQFILMTNRMNDLAGNIVAHVKSGGANGDGGAARIRAMRQQYASIIDSFENSVKQTAVSAYQTGFANANNELSDAIARHGWGMAGSFFFALSSRQDVMSNAIEGAMGIEISSVGDAAGDLTDSASFNSFTAAYNNYAGEANSVISGGVDFSETLEGARNVLERGSTDSEGGLLSAAVDVITGDLTSGFVAAMSGDINNDAGLVNPLSRIRATGNTIVNTVSYFFMGAAVVSLNPLGKLSGIKDRIKGLTTGGASSGIGAIATTIVMALFAAGIIMAYIVPILPFAFWVMAVIAYLIYLVEALLASPFWAILHAHPKGEDVIGGGGNGYPILLTLTLKPVLMVIGLIVGVIIFQVGAWFFLEIVNMSFQITRSGTLPNPLAFVFQMLFTAVMLLIIGYKCFSLPANLSRSFLAWMGVNDSHDLGERETQSQVIAMAAPLAQTAPNAIGAARSSKQASQAAIAKNTAKPGDDGKPKPKADE